MALFGRFVRFLIARGPRGMAASRNSDPSYSNLSAVIQRVVRNQVHQSAALSTTAEPATSEPPKVDTWPGAETEVAELVNRTLRTAILNRPKALNSLNTTMVRSLRHLYDLWEHQGHVHCILLTQGDARAFCAGGDVRAVYYLGKQGRMEEARTFFREEYNLNYEIARLQTPHVAVLDGVCMGGGAGISIHGRYRIVTENTVFAMPEVFIGFHPDVGSSYFLSRLPGQFGTYLGLTGARIKDLDMLALGLATNIMPAKLRPQLHDYLPQTLFASLAPEDGRAVVPSLLSGLALPRHRVHWQVSQLAARQNVINECFGHDTVEEIMEALRSRRGQPGLEWCSDALAAMERASPLSLKVTLRSLREGAKQSLEECLRREYRMSCQALHVGDFYEGVRAMLVDKDNSPKWQPAQVSGVTEEMVDVWFQQLPKEEELRLDKVDKEQPNSEKVEELQSRAKLDKVEEEQASSEKVEELQRRAKI